MKQFPFFFLMYFFIVFGPVYTLFAAEDVREVNLVISSLPEAQGTFGYTKKLPENIDIKASFFLSPVTLKCAVEPVWTPLPFLQLVSAASLGTGWSVPIADGLKINRRSGDHDNVLEGDNFGGVVYNAGGGGALQFDYAAINPGKWNHIVMRSYHSLFYEGLSSAGADESWVFENDEGENQNGWNYYGNLFAGYQMPLFVNTVGLLFEAERRLYFEDNEEEWGGDLIRYTISPLMNFTITNSFTTALICQFRTEKNYTSETGEYGYYKDRVVDSGNPDDFAFYRLVLSCSYIF